MSSATAGGPTVIGERQHRTAGGFSESAPTANFILHGKPFCFLGTNNYYLSYKPRQMVDDVFEAAAKLNLPVVRTWSFIDRGTLDGSVRHVAGADGTQGGVYFQYWDRQQNRPAYNDGPDGLQHLDYVLHKARKGGIRILLVLTNNWRDFGGMDQYLAWYGLDKHHLFFTDERVRRAYKDWVSHLVHRVNAIDGMLYRDDPAIFAWELANEPRTTNGTEFDSPDGWDRTTITTWATEMAAFIKSIDPNHMVSVGDEGFMDGEQSHWAYTTEHGVDHAALLRIADVDFGTFHLYPDHWGTESQWTSDWIRNHITIARRAGKPTILEEYGRTVQRDRDGVIVAGGRRRLLDYSNWNQIMLEGGGNASLYWMLSGISDDGNLYPDYDGLGTYVHDEASKLIAEFARAMQTEAAACRLASTEEVVFSPFVSAQHLTF